MTLGRWISSEWSWDAFGTLTFAPVRGEKGGRRHEVERAMRTRAGGPDWSAVGVSAAERQLDRWLHQVVATRAPHAYWWFTVEAHKFRTTPHFHGLLGGLRGTEWREMWEDWYHGCGSARLEPIHDGDAVAVYVAKYVNKGLGKIYTSNDLAKYGASYVREYVAPVSVAPAQLRLLDRRGRLD